jgi:CHAT domain-containing protein
LILLGPVKHILGEKRLVIVADGALQYIPFAALPDPEATGTAPLVLKHEIVNLPSASVLGALRRRVSRPGTPYSVAVLADPVFEPDDDRLRSGARSTSVGTSKIGLKDRNLTRSAQDLGLTSDRKSYFSRLLYTRNEAEAVALASQPARVMAALDFDASRVLAMNGTLRKYRIVHFATHGILNNKHPELSGLVLSLVNESGQPQQGFLKTKDIYSMRLSADVVVLSGCETGLGEQINGEGIVGLTRAFMYAGANRVVASLWRVSDMATADFMADFYKAMARDHLPPAAALRTAQIKMWRQKQWSAPYFWAAFQIHGDWQ